MAVYFETDRTAIFQSWTPVESTHTKLYTFSKTRTQPKGLAQVEYPEQNITYCTADTGIKKEERKNLVW